MQPLEVSEEEASVIIESLKEPAHFCQFPITPLNQWTPIYWRGRNVHNWHDAKALLDAGLTQRSRNSRALFMRDTRLVRNPDRTFSVWWRHNELLKYKPGKTVFLYPLHRYWNNRLLVRNRMETYSLAWFHQQNGVVHLRGESDGYSYTQNTYHYFPGICIGDNGKILVKFEEF